MLVKSDEVRKTVLLISYPMAKVWLLQSLPKWMVQ